MFVESEALFVVVLPRRGCAMHRMTQVFVFVESEALFVVVLPRRGCAMHRMTQIISPRA